jgi:putative peptidoglycan lipid II flippase
MTVPTSDAPTGNDLSAGDSSAASSRTASAFARQHTAGSAAVLLMVSALLSGLLGLVRIKYINFLFGAGVEQDAYRAAFGLPDLLSYFLIGGAASISVITILNRYREAGDAEGEDRALSIILSTMGVVLGVGILLAAVLAPEYVWLFNKGFRVDTGPHSRFVLCTSLTRWLLPAQFFFFVGSIMSARLQVRKIFLYQAITPLIYNGSIVLGAVFLHRRMGVYSLVVGVLGGVFLGAAVLNSVGAFRTGLRYRFLVGFRSPEFREWLRLSLPLMIGVSIVMFDRFFLSYFASLQVGGISVVLNAKDLFNAPLNVIGPAAGAASFPFFASLFQQKLAADFSFAVSRAVSRLFAVGMLVSGWMIAVAPWLMDLFRGGRFKREETDAMAHLFCILAITLAVWAVQNIYARAFYAASDTLTPAITGVVAVAVCAPLYWMLYQGFGMTGLAFASDAAIMVQTAALAILLHRKRLVSLAHLEYAELGRAFAAAILGYGAARVATHWLPGVSTHMRDGLTIAAASAVWAVAAAAVLYATRSRLLQQILRRTPNGLQ